MNKTHRVVWSDARNCFVAAAENARSKGKPARSRTALAAAIGALFLAPTVALADCVGTSPVSVVLTSLQCYGDQDVTVNAGAGVAVGGASLNAVSISANPYTSTFTNNGVISVLYSTSPGSGYANDSATGLMFNDLGGRLLNAGTIGTTMTVTADSGANQSVSAFGVTTGTVSSTGAITNSGTISARSMVTGGQWGYASAYGITTGDVAGTVSNSGSIIASANSATTDYSTAQTQGIFVNNVQTGGLLTNSGTISSSAVGNASASGSSIWPTAYGVIISGAVDGAFSNTGTITAASSATYGGAGYGAAQAQTYGVYVSNIITATGSLTNSGTIAVSASATAPGDTANAGSSAYGIAASDIEGVVANAGTITATATAMGSPTAGAFATASGIQVNNISATGRLTNSGTITASATATGLNSFPLANGLRMSDIGGAVTNTASGVIRVEAVGNFASGYGVSGGSVLATGSLVNAGTISVSANGVLAGGNTDSAAQAKGFAISDVAGVVTNSGTLAATATSVGGGIGNTNAFGISMGNLTGTLNNSGTISATVRQNGIGNGFDGAMGVSVDTLDGTINNSGTISATGLGDVQQANVYSINAFGGGTGTVNNQAGGVLEGQVALPGSINLNNAGTLNTRSQMSAVGGNYTQATSGLLKIDAMSNTAHGGISVGGTANLAAGTGIKLNALQGNTLAAGTMSGVVTSSGLTMSSATVTDNLLALNYAAVANGNNLDLVATATGISSIASVMSSSGSGSGAGATLDAMLANYDSQPKQIQDFLDVLTAQSTPQGVKDQVQKVLPMIGTSTTMASVGASQSVGNVVLARLENVMGRSAGDKFYGDRKAWLKPFGSWADQDDRNGVSGYSARTAGVVTGVDADVGDYRLGVALGYARSSIDGNSTIAPQNAKVDSYQLVFYGNHGLGNGTEVNFQAGLGTNENSGRRTINFGTTSLVATSDYASLTGYVGGGLSREIKWTEATTFTPMLRADYTWIRNNAYNEAGAGALGLNVNSNDFAKFVVAADGKLVSKLSDRTTLAGNLGVGYDFINETAAITSAFAGTPGAAFVTQGIKPTPWLVRGGAGLTMRTSERVELTGRYDFEARTGFTNQTVSVNARWSF